MSVEADVAVLNVKVRVLEEDQCKLEKATIGDGKGSLSTRVGKLERADLTSNVTKAVIAAFISLIITGAPFVAVVLPKVQRLTEVLEQHAPPAPASPAAGRAP